MDLHTDSKEVDYIRSAEVKMSKKNAANVRADEYYDSLQKAYDLVHMDLGMVLLVEREAAKGEEKTGE